MAFFSVDILTPARALGKGISGEMVELNTEMGMIGILPNHENLLAAVAPGPLVIKDGEKLRVFFLAMGAIRVSGPKITILSSVAELAENIDIERAKRALEKSKEMLKDPLLTDGQTIKYRRKIERAEARIRAAQMVGRQ